MWYKLIWKHFIQLYTILNAKEKKLWTTIWCFLSILCSLTNSHWHCTWKHTLCNNNLKPHWLNLFFVQKTIYSLCSPRSCHLVVGETFWITAVNKNLIFFTLLLHIIVDKFWILHLNFSNFILYDWNKNQKKSQYYSIKVWNKTKHFGYYVTTAVI